ncbi:MAG: hypothetical protein HUJ76_10010, partial [Parasporobacterium sp.]|nr:hypothetical protein [Parasporobacterium sp.]
EEDKVVETLTTMPYDELYTACKEVKVNYAPVFDGDYITTGTFDISADIPLIASNVLGEFSTNYSIVPYSADKETFYADSNITDEDAVQRATEKFGEEYAPQIIEAFKSAYPNHPLRDVLYLGNRLNNSMIKIANAMLSYGGTVYNDVLAYDYPMYGGIVPIHTASSIPFWFNNAHLVPEFIAGDEVNAYKQAEVVSCALSAFAHTGNPSTEEYEWLPYTEEGRECMVFDAYETGCRTNHDKELFELITAANEANGGSSGNASK